MAILFLRSSMDIFHVLGAGVALLAELPNDAHPTSLPFFCSLSLALDEYINGADVFVGDKCWAFNVTSVQGIVW